jgi:hypothetical protein
MYTISSLSTLSEKKLSTPLFFNLLRISVDEHSELILLKDWDEAEKA